MSEGQKELSHSGEAVQIQLPDVGTGTQRTSGTYIAMLLQLEGSDWEAQSVILDVIRIMGWSLDDLFTEYQRREEVENGKL